MADPAWAGPGRDSGLADALLKRRSTWRTKLA